MIRIFGHHLNTIALFLATIELSLLLSLVLASASLLQGLGLSAGPPDHLMIAVIVTLATAAGMISVGLYNRENFFNWAKSMSRAIVIFPLMLAVLVGALWLFDRIVSSGISHREHYLLCALGLALFLPLFLVARRIFVLIVARTGAFTRRVAVLGSGARAGKIESLSQHDQGLNYQITGYVHLDEPPGQPAVLPAPVVCRRKSSRQEDYQIKPGELTRFCQLHRVEELVVVSHERRGLPVSELLECKLAGVGVIEYVSFWERESHQLDLAETTPGWLVFSDGFKTGLIRRLVKRIFDILASVTLLILTLPLLLLTALLIKLESPGSVFYVQERVGLDGKIFTIFKFRSMRSDAEAGGPRWAAQRDARVTRIGALIRKIRIDEIPQAINVLKGDMAFVGPRPERPVFVQNFIEKIPFYGARHRVKPGITGWAQINYPYGSGEEDAKIKLCYDLYYVKNGSIFLDIIIMMQTIKVLIWSSGAR